VRRLLRIVVVVLLAASVVRTMGAVAGFEGHPLRELRAPTSTWQLRADAAALFPAATAFFPRLPEDEGAEATGSFVRWEWSEDGLSWSVATPPRSARGRLLQRAFFRANPRMLPARLALVGQGCLASVSINKVTRLRRSCAGSATPAWEPLRLTGLVWPGLNLLEVEVLGKADLDAAELGP
jgi:hypothetical protein